MTFKEAQAQDGTHFGISEVERIIRLYCQEHLGREVRDMDVSMEYAMYVGEESRYVGYDVAFLPKENL